MVDELVGRGFVAYALVARVKAKMEDVLDRRILDC